MTHSCLELLWTHFRLQRDGGTPASSHREGRGPRGLACKPGSIPGGDSKRSEELREAVLKERQADGGALFDSAVAQCRIVTVSERPASRLRRTTSRRYQRCRGKGGRVPADL